MGLNESSGPLMPDIAASSTGRSSGVLDRVGMAGIQTAVRLRGCDGQLQQLPARASAFVDLIDPTARGIHMSRLFLLLDTHLQQAELSPQGIASLLRSFLRSHEQLSESASVRIEFDWLVRRRALRSDNSGWRSYPVAVRGRLDETGLSVELELSLQYSSTCPCSAALARQLIQQRFDQDFASTVTLDQLTVRDWLGTEQGIVATPHSQRSELKLRARLTPAVQAFPLQTLVDRLEQALATPVQTAVKREDEQAFALANGQNPMFCEDAARRAFLVLDEDAQLSDFLVHVSHLESLHPHDAQAWVCKGVKGGLRPDI